MKHRPPKSPNPGKVTIRRRVYICASCRRQGGSLKKLGEVYVCNPKCGGV